MKKAISLLLALIMTMSLAACTTSGKGGDDDGKSSGASDGTGSGAASSSKLQDYVAPDGTVYKTYTTDEFYLLLLSLKNDDSRKLDTPVPVQIVAERPHQVERVSDTLFNFYVDNMQPSPEVLVEEHAWIWLNLRYYSDDSPTYHAASAAPDYHAEQKQFLNSYRSTIALRGMITEVYGSSFNNHGEDVTSIEATIHVCSTEALDN